MTRPIDKVYQAKATKPTRN